MTIAETILCACGVLGVLGGAALWLWNLSGRISRREEHDDACTEKRKVVLEGYERRAQILEATADSNRDAIADLRNFAAEIRVKLEYLHTSNTRQEGQLETLTRSMARVEQLLNGGLKHE